MVHRTCPTTTTVIRFGSLRGAIHLVRHGEVFNPRGIRYGRLPGFHLSERGRRQIAATRQRLLELGPIDRVVSSPLERAVETAEILAASLPIQLDERVTEAWSLLDGLSKLAPLWPSSWRHFTNPFQPSWGEPFAHVADRMARAIAELRGGGTVVIVSHQSPIWIARHARRSSGPPWTSRIRCERGSVTTLAADGSDLYWSPPQRG